MTRSFIHRSMLLCAALLPFIIPAQARAAGDQPVIFSQTVIAIVPGSTVPRAITQSPALQSALRDETDENEGEEDDSENAEVESATADIRADLATPAVTSRMRVRVMVRPEQIPLEDGLFQNYKLDAEHGILTYFAESAPRPFIAENIQKPLDVLFIRDDGIIAQIVPEVVPAFIAESIEVDFPVRALLYLEAGLSAAWGVQPGYRVEHGMFTPRPLIYTAPKEMVN